MNSLNRTLNARNNTSFAPSLFCRPLRTLALYRTVVAEEVHSWRSEELDALWHHKHAGVVLGTSAIKTLARLTRLVPYLAWIRTRGVSKLVQQRALHNLESSSEPISEVRVCRVPDSLRRFDAEDELRLLVVLCEHVAAFVPHCYQSLPERRGQWLALNVAVVKCRQYRIVADTADLFLQLTLCALVIRNANLALFGAGKAAEDLAEQMRAAPPKRLCPRCWTSCDGAGTDAVHACIFPCVG